jgi:hypothetical protein
MQLATLRPEVLPNTPAVTATLMACKGTNKLSRMELAKIDTPPATSTFQPIKHSSLIDELENALAYRHISIKRGEFAVSQDGMKLFALLVLSADYDGIDFAIGCRNANDKSMRLSLVAGYSVLVCSNLSFHGDFHPLLAKHSKKFDLVDAVSTGIDRIQRGWNPLRHAIDFKRQRELTTPEAQCLIYKAFTEQKFPAKLLRTVHSEYFVKPSHEEFASPTLWALENAFTTSFKQLKPQQQFPATAKLGKFIGALTSN